MNTIYAVVRIDNTPNRFGCNVYSKQSSNLAKMKEYKAEIASKYLSAKVVLVSRESAQQIKKEYAAWFDKYETAHWNQAYNNAIKKSLQERSFL